ncbi:hypothetical protein K443DRAFT_13847 [Laccaria amethystina LaAM-08-1]|uniref:Uncharacterized protein n=1 Tax=Laccaria amethystina LaAM-08-1 TaxID=1095629 RepID=A0A0C9WI06_9AGAR|nr:hypothetical protein K443DRAFT_13847 [Laccaria amethystina LaAM-08-1]
MSLPELTPKPLLNFPPFPPVPEGPTILPFDSFKEKGIQIAPSQSAEEVDGLGIPTVELIKNVKKVKEEVVPVPVADPIPNHQRTYYDYRRRDW